MAERSTRQAWLDGLKGFAIILVILGHVLSGYMDADIFPDSYNSFWYLRMWIYSFHMPLFFLISGYAFTIAYYRNGKLSGRRWLKQTLSLIWLYLLFSLLQWAVKQAVPGLVNVNYDGEDIKKILYEPMGNYWYLYVLILYYVLAPLVRLPKQHAMWLLLLGGMALMVYSYYYQLRTETEYRFFYHLVFFALGCKLSQHREILKSKKLRGIAAMILATAFWYYIFIWVRHWVANWAFLIALSTCWVFTALFYRCPKISEFRLFQLYGKYCLEIYLLHTFLTAGLRSVLPLFGITTPWLSIWTDFLISASASLGLAVFFRKLEFMDIVFRPFKVIKRFGAIARKNV